MAKTNSNNPLITVAMPIYNAGEYLRAAVLSIMQQTLVDWEMIIIDDGSTDDALTSIDDIIDARIKVIKDGFNKGLAARLNEVIEIANGQYIARMDQDDISLPNRLEVQLNYLLKNPTIDLVSCKTQTINMLGQTVGFLPFKETHRQIISKPWMSFYMPHPSWLGKSAWFKQFKYASSAPYFCEDQELLLRSYSHSQFASINEILFQYRVRDKVNFKKTIKTYFAIWQFQLSQFNIEKPLYSTLSSVVLILRASKLIFDKLRRVK